MIIWVVKIFLYSSSSVYSCHLFLISSASVRSIPFLSFILLIFAWNVCLHSDKSQVCCLIVSLSLVIIYGCVRNHLRRHWLKTVSILFLLMNLLLGQGSWEKTCLWSTRVSWYGSDSLGRSSSAYFTRMPGHLVWDVVWQLSRVVLWEPCFLRSKTPRLEASSLF